MLKLLGALLIVACGGLGGYVLSREYARRPPELKAWLTVLQRLETEISYAATPLGEALAKIAPHSGCQIQAAVQQAADLLNRGHSAAEAFDQALESTYARSSLRISDLGILNNLALALGISDCQDQIRHLQLAGEQLKVEIVQAEEEARKNVKLYNYLGVCSGIALVLLVF
ncbi:MAG: stage III sporulation protein AB [Clostridia bacterium]|nr:stage III sporulation protein AB [Clostridia bacterium]